MNHFFPLIYLPTMTQIVSVIDTLLVYTMYVPVTQFSQLIVILTRNHACADKEGLAVIHIAPSQP